MLHADHDRLLDVGTGPARLLLEVHRLNPHIALFGLDISHAMVELATKNLSGMNAQIRLGNIRATHYDSDFFDFVTCSGSFYLWDNAVEGLEETYRILRRQWRRLFV